jgi:hypothetical protein
MPRRSYDDDSDLEDRPRRRHKKPGGKRPKNRGMSVALIVGLALGGVFLIGGGAVAAVLLLRDRSTGTAQAQDPFPSMLAHWSFDKVKVNPDESTTIFDETGRGNDGRMTGGKLAPGRKGNALWLDGREDQYVDVSKAKDLQAFAPGTELTIAAWFQTRERTGGTIVAFHHPEYPTQLDIFVRDYRVIGIIGDDNDTTGRHAFVWGEDKSKMPPTASNGQWHHVAMTRRERIVEVFYDGVSQGIDARGNSGGKLSGGEGAIGCHLGFVRNSVDMTKFGRAGFKGAIDEVYVFGRALSESEIQRLMQR